MLLWLDILRINEKATQLQEYKKELIKKIAKIYEKIRYYEILLDKREKTIVENGIINILSKLEI
jgi:hypothetical protein